MKKLFIIFILIIVAVLAFILFRAEEPEKPEPSETIEYIAEGETIRVLDKEENVVFEYSIDEFKDWAKENWQDIFEEPPRFAPNIPETEVFPEDFGFFDRTASISPDKEKLAFSVHSYYAASYLSLVGIIDLKTEEPALTAEANRGGVVDIFWSPAGNHLAYALDTGRAQGDYLSVDNVTELEKEFTLSGEDILNVLQNSDYAEFMPHFRDLKWIDQGQRLKFTTDGPEEEALAWSIKTQGTDLKQETEKTTIELPLPFVDNIEIDAGQFALPVLAIILGAVDGLNVCSIGALILVLSLVLVLKDTRLILLCGGLFLLIVAAVYGLLVFIWGGIYHIILPYFPHISIIYGTAALLGGLYFFKEFLRLKKVGLACRISESKLMKRVTEYLQETFQSPKKSIPRLALAVIIFAAIATVVEFPCSFWLPVFFTGFLADVGVSTAGYVFYLFLYLLFYLLIEVVVFIIAVAKKKVWMDKKFIVYAALGGSLMLFYLAYYSFSLV